MHCFLADAIGCHSNQNNPTIKGAREAAHRRPPGLGRGGGRRRPGLLWLRRWRFVLPRAPGKVVSHRSRVAQGAPAVGDEGEEDEEQDEEDDLLADAQAGGAGGGLRQSAGMLSVDRPVLATIPGLLSPRCARLFDAQGSIDGLAQTIHRSANAF